MITPLHILWRVEPEDYYFLAWHDLFSSFTLCISVPVVHLLKWLTCSRKSTVWQLKKISWLYCLQCSLDFKTAVCLPHNKFEYSTLPQLSNSPTAIRNQSSESCSEQTRCCMLYYSIYHYLYSESTIFKDAMQAMPCSSICIYQSHYIYHTISSACY